MDRKNRGTKILIVLLILMISFCSYVYIDNNRIIILEENIYIENLPKEFEDFKILQISDLHEKSFGKNQTYLIDKVNSIKYDMVAITGDMGNEAHTSENTAFFNLLDRIDNKEYVFYIRGNDGPIDLDENNVITKMGQNLIDKGCILLDKPYLLQRAEEKMWISTLLNKANFSNQAEEAQDRDIKIVIEHYPRDRRYYEEVSVGNLPNYDLILAGHYHGGQYRIPFIGALFIPNPNPHGQRILPNQEEVSGLTNWGGYKQYVSRGLGANYKKKIFQFRLFNPPELNVITLKKE